MPAKQITYPYKPEGVHFNYVDTADPYLRAAADVAREKSLDKTMPVGSVIVLKGKIIGRGANGSDFHTNNDCVRVLKGSKTGEEYELCEGCNPANHSEARAVAEAIASGIDKEDLKNAEIYTWGHWWCCKSCWNAMLGAGITTVNLMKGSEVLFNKEAEGNAVGSQFETYEQLLA